MLLASGLARGQTSPACCARSVHSIKDLACLSWCELEALYRAARPGAPPAGYVPGLPIYDPAKRLSSLRGKVTGMLWRGKHFRCDGSLINQWCGLRAIRAEVYYGTSWLDGGPAVIMDYGNSSWVWADVRDEIREVAPGVFLGVMYLRRCPQPRLKMFFALDATSPACPTVLPAEHP
jgi:hypothetical protein